MPALLLGPLLRHVSRTTATIWVETDSPCEVEVLGHRSSTFSVFGHHYALVIVEGLDPGTTVPYEVHLDGSCCWPEPESTFPPSVIRTLDGGAIRILFGSCRAAAPHEPPWTLDHDDDPRGRGVDALLAHGLRMLQQPAEEWPQLLLFVGDQVYADDSSPGVRAKVIERRGHLDGDDQYPSLDDVADFEEYTWLYHESWSQPVERWLLSVVPSAMIFDDHDMIDDWNTSVAWVNEIREQPWWQKHAEAGLMSYWVYQHLGNLSPDNIRSEGMLARFVTLGDAGPALQEWARASEEFTPVPGGYRFSYGRELGPVRLVVIDSRNGRVLTPERRQMIDDEEWAFVADQARQPCEHLVLATSIPLVMPGGLHDIERWDELVGDGAWGRWGRPVAEKLRQALDLEDWASFHDSYLAFMELLRAVATPGTDPAPRPPTTVSVVSGDVHFSYRAAATFPERVDQPATVSRVNQIVNSPIRNVLATRERRAIKVGLSWAGTLLGRMLRRLAGGRPDEVRWDIADGPYFANHVCLLEFDEQSARMVFERATADADVLPRLSVVAETSL